MSWNKVWIQKLDLIFCKSINFFLVQSAKTGDAFYQVSLKQKEYYFELCREVILYFQYTLSTHSCTYLQDHEIGRVFPGLRKKA